METRVILEVPLADYHLCLTRLPLNSPAYKLLKNGVVVRNDKDEEVVHILCETTMAVEIWRAFRRGCPEALDRIRELPV
jgi:hypothetical protein